MCTYLTKRGSTYWFRRPIPAALRPFVDGATQFMFTLGTKDKAVAKQHWAKAVADTDERLRTAESRRARHAAIEAPGESISAPDPAGHGVSEHDLDGAEIAHREDLEQEARREAREDEHHYWKKRMRFTTQELSAREAAVKDMLAEKDFDLELAKNEIRHLRSLLDTAKRAGDTRLLEKPAPIVDDAPPAVAEGVMLDEKIIDLWAAEREVVKKGIDTHRAVARWFYERIGRKPVADITRADVIVFKDKLIAEGQSPANTLMKLSRLRTLLQWAADNNYAAENAAATVRIKVAAKAGTRRLEFDLTSLNQIFASPVFAEGARPTQGRGEAAYWLPLLALFAGARLEELGQLRPQDVQEMSYPDVDGAMVASWFIRIRPDKQDNMRLKNAGSERDVPVHPELIRHGLLDYVKAATAAGHSRLFPLLRPNVYGRLSAKWGEWFGRYLRNECGVTDRRLVFHSFRHTFKQYARHAGIEEGIQRQIMGHSPGDVADEYGSGYPLHRVVEGMGRFRVPGLSLP